MNNVSFEERKLRRFHSSYIPEPMSGCWLWIAQWDNKFGYGRFTARRRYIFAHRLSWIIHNGAIPAGLCVLHKCDNPACVNPDHLFLGTQKDNAQDMWAKGRNAAPYPPIRIGEDHHNARLTEVAVREIRTKFLEGRSKASLAREYNMSESAIYFLIARRTWTHVQ